MDLKDFYDILELPPSATTEEIKKSYRRMALAYHPDKTGDDPYAAARFAVVKEAYEVLTDPARKNLYLQERWLAKSSGRMKAAPILNPETLLKQAIEKERSVARMDKYRMNKNGLLEELQLLFSPDAVDMLNRFGDRKINAEIIGLAIRSAGFLDYPAKSAFFSRLALIDTEDAVGADLRRNLSKQRDNEKWERAKIWLLLFVVTAICVLIFIVGR